MFDRLQTLPESAKKSYAAIIGPLGLIIVDSLARDIGTVQADADFTHRIATAIPSAFVAPEISEEITGKKSPKFDEAVAAGGLAISAALASKTSRPSELVVVAATAQLGSCLVDGAVSHENLLSHHQESQLDVGPSAIIGAFLMKFCLDKRRSSPTRGLKRTWTVSSAALTAGMTIGASYVDSKNSSLDFTSHSVGLATGAAASYFKAKRNSADYPATDGFAVGVENC